MFGVSPKAVRDIWNKRTWRHCTQAQWTEEDILQSAEYLISLENGMAARKSQNAGPKISFTTPRNVGRPRGSKDSKLRRPRNPLLAKSRGKPLVFITNNFEGTALCNEAAAIDPNTILPYEKIDEFKEDNYSWANAISAPESRVAIALDDWEEDDLRRSFPFFLGLEDQAATSSQEYA